MNYSFSYYLGDIFHQPFWNVSVNCLYILGLYLKRKDETSITNKLLHQPTIQQQILIQMQMERFLDW